MKKNPAYHPLLFAIFPILSIFQFNMAQMPYGERQIIIPVLISLAGTAAAWGVLSLILKSGRKAGIFTSILVLLFFSYGHVYSYLISSNVGFTIRYSVLYVAWFVIIIISGFFIIRTKSDLINVTKILNLVALVLVLMPVAGYSAKKVMISSAGLKMKFGEESVEKITKVSNPRNIYYIIVDGYPNVATLKDVFNCDISEFTTNLKEKGFFIASKSRSNYAFTATSMAASMNMDYLDKEIAPYRKKKRADLLITTKINSMREDNKIKDFLKKRGYTLIFFSSGFQLDNQNRYFDVPNRCGRENEFMFNIMNTTMLVPLHGYYVVKMLEDARESIYACIEDEITKIPEKSPYFAFAHLDVSHPPHIDPDSPQFCSQLNAYNKNLEKMLDGILAAEKNRAPIIVMQADHGTSTINLKLLGLEGKWDFDKMIADEPEFKRGLRENMRIFNAYYFPDGGDAKLYDSVTPVNTFRIMFNYYFDTDFKLLEDKSMFSFNPKWYDFHNVNEWVNF